MHINSVNCIAQVYKLFITIQSYMFVICLGCEIYGQMTSSFLLLLSQGTITNYGNIMVNNQEDIDIQCLHFENHGKIQSKNHENKIIIRCLSFANEGSILPEQIVFTPLNYLVYDENRRKVMIDEDKMNKDMVKEWLLMALKSIKYEIKYLDANDIALKSQKYECKKDEDFAIPIDHNYLWYSSITLTETGGRSKSFKLSKLSELILNEQKEPFHIAQAIKVSEYGNGLSFSIKCASDIIIEKNGSIIADGSNKCFEYESDFDENGIFYALGTRFGTTAYTNPAKIGLIDLNSTNMYTGNVLNFTGREKVGSYTKDEDGSFFSIDLKQYRVKPNAYTLRNSNYGSYHLKSWNFEGSNNGKTWHVLKEHKDDSSLNGNYKSKTWQLANVNECYSFFRIIMTDKNREDQWELHCSGIYR